ncbi:hypothetical protein BD413DRAFT_187625 [Trametes elegans]|nr:hypothetical protein BD413DRAFT_187625 [Trametes elegans]
MASPGNVARGLKAAISSPYNPQAAKQRAQERLQQMEASGELDPREAHEGNAIIGHKHAKERSYMIATGCCKLCGSSGGSFAHSHNIRKRSGERWQA